MIEIKADPKKYGNEMGIEVIIKIDSDNEKTTTKELFAILKALYVKYPKILMDAVNMHIKDLMVDEMKEGDDND